MLQRLVLLVTFLLLSASVVFAQDEICPAVYPCLESGELDPSFNFPGFCGEKFRELCANVKTSQISDQLVACEQENSNFKSKEASLSKEIRSLRKKLRKAKND